jgi:hypothetical protein
VADPVGRGAHDSGDVVRTVGDDPALEPAGDCLGLDHHLVDARQDVAGGDRRLVAHHEPRLWPGEAENSPAERGER